MLSLIIVLPLLCPVEEGSLLDSHEAMLMKYDNDEIIHYQKAMRYQRKITRPIIMKANRMACVGALKNGVERTLSLSFLCPFKSNENDLES